MNLEYQNNEYSKSAYSEYLKMKKSLDFITVPIKFLEDLQRENRKLQEKVYVLNNQLTTYKQKENVKVNVVDTCKIPDDSFIRINDFHNKYGVMPSRVSISQHKANGNLLVHKVGRSVYIHERTAFKHYVQGIKWNVLKPYVAEIRSKISAENTE